MGRLRCGAVVTGVMCVLLGSVTNPAGQFMVLGPAADAIFTVPAGVTKVSIACGGRGGARDTGSTTNGGGGGLGILNDFAVVPGETYTVKTPGFAQVLRADGSNVVAANGAFYHTGGAGAAFNGGNGDNLGNVGQAARWTANGGTVVPTNADKGVSPRGLNADGTPRGAADRGFGATTENIADAGGNFVRIVWGDGRSFPYNAADV